MRQGCLWRSQHHKTFQDYDRPHPEDGGYDVAWPSVCLLACLPLSGFRRDMGVSKTACVTTQGPDEHEEFSATVAETVNDKGRAANLNQPRLWFTFCARYCVIEMPMGDECCLPTWERFQSAYDS